jgi:hypothetical protein
MNSKRFADPHDSDSDVAGEDLTRTVAGDISQDPEAGFADSADDPRDRRIARAAYYRAEHRGFEPGHELDDWLAAEAEIAQREGAGSIG